MKKYFLAVLAFTFFVYVAKVQAQPAPQTADEIFSNAVQKAKQQHKKVLIMFHASWCGWCKKMDASIDDPSIKKYFDDNFVIQHITVMEHGDKVALDNPGGQAMLEKYGGGEEGIPYWLIFDENGHLLANSKLNSGSNSQEEGHNMGCPTTELEVNYFIGLLKKNTSLSEEDAKAIHDRFRKNEVKGN